MEFIAESIPQKLDDEKEFKNKLDEIYLRVLDLFDITSFINSDELISYIFTMDDSFISKYNKAIKVDLIVEYFKTHNLIEKFDDEQKEFINSKMRLFSVL